MACPDRASEPRRSPSAREPSSPGLADTVLGALRTPDEVGAAPTRGAERFLVRYCDHKTGDPAERGRDPDAGPDELGPPPPLLLPGGPFSLVVPSSGRNSAAGRARRMLSRVLEPTRKSPAETTVPPIAQPIKNSLAVVCMPLPRPMATNSMTEPTAAATATMPDKTDQSHTNRAPSLLGANCDTWRSTAATTSGCIALRDRRSAPRRRRRTPVAISRCSK
jgi:hypothetical protein